MSEDDPRRSTRSALDMAGNKLPAMWSGIAATSVALWLVALGTTSPGWPVAARSAALAAIFVAVAVAGAVAAWLIARSHDRRRVAEGESLRRAEMLEQASTLHTRTADELQRAKEAAEAANEAKTRYLVAVSHEIRSPLNAIYGYAQLLERDGAVSGAEAGAVIRRSAEHLTNLVEGLLEISRIESGVLKLRSDVVELPVLFEGVVDMFRMQAAAKGLTLDLVLKDRLPQFVRTDEKRLRQILINLIANAIKYTQTGGATVTVRYRSQVADVEVSDTGIGIAADEIERIFEPFERGSSPEAMFQPGIGLGLSFTRLLTHVLGGDIVVTSTPGVGSKFRLRMLLPEPLNPPAGAGAGARGDRVVGYEGPRRTVLVIDDDAAQGTVLQTLLGSLGFVVHLAGGGTEGIALAERCAVDMVLLDIQMPGMSGWEVAAQLRAAHGDALRIALVSANVHEFRAGGDGHSHHDAFITKPVDLDALLSVVGTQLGLTWQRTRTEAAIPAESAAPPLPPEAVPFLEALRRLAKVGHVRGIENMLDEMDGAVPEAAALVAVLRRHAGDFNLKSIAKALDHVEVR